VRAAHASTPPVRVPDAVTKILEVVAKPRGAGGIWGLLHDGRSTCEPPIGMSPESPIARGSTPWRWPSRGPASSIPSTCSLAAHGCASSPMALVRCGPAVLTWC